MAPSQTAAKSSQPGGKDIRSFFGGSGSQKPAAATKNTPPAPKKPKKEEAIEISVSPSRRRSLKQAQGSRQVALHPQPSLVLITIKRKKAAALLSSDDEDTPPKKKPTASNSKAKSRLLSSDEDASPPKKTKAKPRVSKAKARDSDFVVSSDDDEVAPPKKKPAASSSKPKPRVSKSKDDDFIASSDDEKPAAKKTASKAKAGPSKVPDKPKAAASGKGKEKAKEEPTEPKYNWAAARAAKLAGPTAPGSKDIPDGAPECLAGLSFVFTGELSSFSRDEAVDLAKRFGGRVVGQPSGKTDYVVLGDNAGPSKLNAIKKHGLKTLSEDEFLHLIATRKGTGQLDEKTLKKMEKEKEAIETAAKEMEKREKKAAKEQANSSKPSIDPSSQLWTTRYAPQNLKEICGNKGQVEKLQQWLKDWPSSVKSGFKKPGKNGMNIFRAVLITGPPGIGKTTSAHMIARLEGFTPIELNASDARSKKLVENGMNVNNASLDGYIAGSRETDGVKITDRTVLIMDEVDGMSSGDRGGVGALNAMIKKSKVPIICIANDRGAQKLKPLVATTFSLSFSRPPANAIRSRLMTIAFKEKMKIPANVLDQLVAGSQSDIRQVLNMLSTWRLSSDTMTHDEGKALSRMNEKYTIMSPFDITSKMLGPYMFSATARESLGDKMELYFQDHSFMPLFIQENYLKTDPAKLRNYDGPMKQVKALELMDKAASSISDGDLVDALIHGPEQHWSLMPLHAVCSTVRPASFLYGTGAHYGGPNSLSFPHRQLSDVQIRMRLKVSGDKSEVRQSYIPALFPHIVRPLIEVGASAVDEIIERMDEYFLTKEDWDTIVELGVDDKKDDQVLKKISAATKTALTRKYNSSEHPIPFYKASDLGKAPKKLAGGPAPDIEDAFDMDEPVEDASEDETAAKDPDDISKDKLIKPTKKKAAKKPPAKSKK
ncbi:replication factor RFC1 C terminal domain-containing protein [Mycena rebaudengoi]|nr:replication factor RFC1 C terminal domain-containing protein [Mycena rebaudengoi]